MDAAVSKRMSANDVPPSLESMYHNFRDDAISCAETMFDWRKAFRNDPFAFLIKELKHQLVEDDAVKLYFMEIKKFLLTSGDDLSQEERSRREVYGVILREACLKWFGLDFDDCDDGDMKGPYVEATKSLAQKILGENAAVPDVRRNDLLLLLPHVVLQLLLSDASVEMHVFRYMNDNYTSRCVPTGEVPTPGILCRNTWDPFLDYIFRWHFQMAWRDIEAYRNCMKRCFRAATREEVHPRDRHKCAVNMLALQFASRIWYGLKRYDDAEHELSDVLRREKVVVREDGSSAFSKEDQAVLLSYLMIFKYHQFPAPH